MSRLYIVGFGGQPKPNSQDLFGIYCGSIALRLREFRIIADNAVSEQNLDITIGRLAPTITRGSGGNVATPLPVVGTDVAASFIAHTNDTVQASTTGAYEFLVQSGANILHGWTYTPAHDCCPVFQPGDACVIGGGESTGSSVVYSAYAVFEEMF